jgi:SAM-dependent methyltransferase
MNEIAHGRQRLMRLRRPAWLGTIRRTSPLSDHFGRERGTPVDRYYIERFLQGNSGRIGGRVLEVKDSDYTRRFGRDVSRGDVLDIDARNPDATVVADLVGGSGIETGVYDCFILTQTLHYIFDVGAALEQVHRILSPGGTALCTVPVVSRIGRGELSPEYWRFTPATCKILFERAFPGGELEVRGRGNVLACVAFLVGMAAEELKVDELEADDPFFPLLVTVRATKAALTA